MSKVKGRRTPKKNESGKGEAWTEAMGAGSMNARPVSDTMGCAGSKIVSHRTQVQDQPVSYAAGMVQGGGRY